LPILCGHSQRGTHSWVTRFSARGMCDEPIIGREPVAEFGVAWVLWDWWVLEKVFTPKRVE
jgi:hypothetical protein